MLRSLLLPSVLALPLTSDIPIDNPSFESPNIPAGTFATTAPPDGWSAYGSVDFGFRTVGVLDPTGTAYYPGGAPHGENVGVVFLLDDPNDQSQFAGIEAGLEQVLDEVLAPATRYTLSVALGNIASAVPQGQFEFDGFPGYRVELAAGGTVLASEVNTQLPPEGEFLTVTLQADVGPAHPNLGQPLRIRLGNLNADVGIEVNFDDVRLTADVSFTRYCTSSINSVGDAPLIDASGSASATAANLTLTAAQVPDTFGLFFHAVDQTSLPFGCGTLCANTDLRRGGVVVPTGNVATYVYDGSQPNRSLLPFIGTVRHFSYWYRDPAHAGVCGFTFNATDAISIAVTP